ncbi:MAG: sulfite exporter TauE/SafE family protein [Kordiimonadaceae bacterium]|nr:sulfite exporter TauE/SafE family protein [Kordiimonadaceae bacterium]MBT6032226.1 sulfite exporter TauE/SafE family protein [Kordiimonadaceae bacterium]
MLLLATLIASTVQSATGFGFALMTVPAFLILRNSTDAIQIAIIISVVMSVVHWPKLKNMVPYSILKWVIIGGTIGFPIGILIYKSLDLDAIKMAVAIFIILISLQNGWNLRAKSNPDEKKDHHKGILSVVGLLSGILGSAMAMPGPILMLYLSRMALSKNEIRAAMISFFVFAYSGALLLQILMVGVAKDTWLASAILTPAALIGVFVGHQISKKINEKLFKGLVLLILILTGIFMLINL